ncbi:heavy metal-associated isoprenylated plant protein 41-like [Asparagus officinalis]|uniref:heavy metal-associated isoprenylated plant protein 41-like n=1 Tax=Asparagus officinalis TaxID=4686 RepID=UPI00098DF331|nr:heavy metal-associated isoprenylated plant protein 41-like [Asparagus officinalis]
MRNQYQRETKRKKLNERRKKMMRRRREEEEEEEEEITVKWAKHYSSIHQILIVGDGDFSFSLSLAYAFGSAFNIVATSKDSYVSVLKKYKRAKSNLQCLKELGATILHGVDATKMKYHTELRMQKFDRIVFNFPHAGFKGKEDNMRVMNLHKKLVNGFFKNASRMLRPYGEVHVSHKVEHPFHKWNLEELASKSSLIMIECTNFSIEDYPGYNNKRGDGSRCDQPFRLGECRTFMFRIGDIHKKKRAEEIAVSNPRPLESFVSENLPPIFLYDVKGIGSTIHYPLRIGASNLRTREPSNYGFDACQEFWGFEYPLNGSYERYMNEAHRYSESDYLNRMMR